MSQYFPNPRRYPRIKKNIFILIPYSTCLLRFYEEMKTFNIVFVSIFKISFAISSKCPHNHRYYNLVEVNWGFSCERKKFLLFDKNIRTSAVTSPTTMSTTDKSQLN